ncbi:MAG: putative ABC transporter permease [Clostridia bacterium]|nr:putative ABC transporter permease [Clostridia bacterium]
MILGYSIYELLSLFFIYGFLGWCVEVAYCGVENGNFVNRGFLNGPICPIYGFGAVIVILCLTPIKDNVLILFIGSAVLTSLLELATGFALDKIFHARWWDYSDKPFNLGGYICLKFSIYWGLVCIALMKGIHPAIFKLVKAVPHFLGIIILVFLTAVFIADITVTVITVNKLSKRIKLMDDIAEKIRAVSDEIGEHVFEGTSAVVKKGEEIYNSEEVQEIREKYAEEVEEFKQKQVEIKAKYEKEREELKEKYAEMVKESHLFQRRIIKAFPNIRSHRHSEQLEKLKAKFKK